jgi:Fe-S-cluster-containing dehydrogenase component/formate-dependent nitrite reductase membrane component NrfD
MKYGFLVDNRKCIGCHSCTVACKTENHVPLGVNRTWVKYVEKGKYPNTRRFFLVSRCNHCENPPCVAICPVNAMYQSSEGIVDFNPSRCMGCKACMQACPYDAIYIDPDRKTAAKCHFCAHRVEIGLEPACVAVCPEHAIIAGDLDDPSSEIARLLEREPVRVRRPEQGTKPKLYYIDADETAIVPTAARHEAFYMWSERNRKVQGEGATFMPGSPFLHKDALAAYDVAHERPWGWQVPVYFWLKSMFSGLLILPGIATAGGWLAPHRIRDMTLTSVALVLLAATLVLLVWDLSLRKRFLNCMLTPQIGSWISRGAYILAAFGVVGALLWLSSLANVPALSAALAWPAVLVGLLSAAYTAFLFGQCEGCDLWQSPLLPLQLVLHAFLSGGAFLALLPESVGGGSAEIRSVAFIAIAGGLLLHLSMLGGQFAMPQATDNAGYAARLITRGPYRLHFWIGAVALGGILPALLLLAGGSSSPAVALAGILALGGLLAFEWCFIMAGQRVPNS